MSLLKNTAIFICGFGLGCVITHEVIKSKYESIAKEEIESVKEVFKRRTKKEKSKVSNFDDALRVANKVLNEDEVNKQYDSFVSKLGYNGEEEEEMVDRPYVISPEEVGDCDYEMIALTYSDDGILLDDLDEIVDDVDVTVGVESLNHFGEYEEDSVYVRNDRLRVDYEILRDDRTHNEIVRQPHRMEE